MLDLTYLVQHRGDPAVRLVLSDHELLSRGRKSRALMGMGLVNTAAYTTAGAAAYSSAYDMTADITAAAAYITDAAYITADAAYTTAASSATDTADAADDATDATDTADAAYTTADAAAAAFSRMLAKEIDMREGLKLIKLPGYYGPVRVGWLRRIDGDNYELLPGSVLVIRTSGSRALAELAADGPVDRSGEHTNRPVQDHKLTDKAGTAHDVNEFRVWQAIDCGDAWREFVPQPKEWR